MTATRIAPASADGFNRTLGKLTINRDHAAALAENARRREVARADNLVITCAHAIALAIQYGIPAEPAHRSYDEACARRDRLRRNGGGLR